MSYLSKRSQEGYILVDHTNSPGITAEDLLTVPEPKRSELQPMLGLYESPTLRCAHCGGMVVINPQRTRARNYCSKCDHYVCDLSICIKECTPFIKTVDITIEQAAQLLNVKEV